MKSLKFPRISFFFPEKDLALRHFTEIKKLGKGSFGQVALYLHNATQKPYAIKRISFVLGEEVSISR
jgi:serine/threonine protein kinase